MPSLPVSAMCGCTLAESSVLLVRGWLDIRLHVVIVMCSEPHLMSVLIVAEPPRLRAGVDERAGCG